MGTTVLNILFLPSLFLLTLQLPQNKAENFCKLANNYTISATNPELAASNGGKCNNFQGKWVFDSKYPLYDSLNCPFIDLEFNCQSRPDKLFQKYRWQPFGCNLPRYIIYISFSNLVGNNGQ